MSNSNWEALSAERKALQADGVVPAFMTTAGYAMFKAKYTVADQSVRERYETIASTAGSPRKNWVRAVVRNSALSAAVSIPAVT